MKDYTYKFLSAGYDLFTNGVIKHYENDYGPLYITGTTNDEQTDFVENIDPETVTVEYYPTEIMGGPLHSELKVKKADEPLKEEIHFSYEDYYYKPLSFLESKPTLPEKLNDAIKSLHEVDRVVRELFPGYSIL